MNDWMTTNTVCREMTTAHPFCLRDNVSTSRVDDWMTTNTVCREKTPAHPFCLHDIAP